VSGVFSPWRTGFDQFSQAPGSIPGWITTPILTQALERFIRMLMGHDCRSLKQIIDVNPHVMVIKG
jgi:hypothetical protein